VSGARFPERLRQRLRLPLIAAPMLHVSGPELVIAACRGGVIGAFPTANARTVEELDGWFEEIERGRAEGPAGADGSAPCCPNLIIRQTRLAEDLACVVRHRVEVVITSVGSPAAVVGPLHEIGAFVFSDVATLRHAEKALAAGADGLILLTAGAGGQTGWLNPFAFVRAVRTIFDGPIVLAGGVSDGTALWAAQVLGCDLAYMGTKFIATNESLAGAEYKGMLVESGIDDVVLTSAFTGLPTSMLLPSILAAGLDPAKLDEQVSVPGAAEMYGGKASGAGPKRWRDVWSAGHSVSGIERVQPVAGLIEQTLREYEAARGAAQERYPARAVAPILRSVPGEKR
jgi:nitronate monooxygenase